MSRGGEHVCVTTSDLFHYCVQRWVPEIRKHCPRTPIIISGNKKDLRNDEYTSGHSGYDASFEEAQQIGKEVGAEAVLECSALRQEGLQTLLEHAVRATMLKPGYNRRSKRDKTCKRCGSLSKESCDCERALQKVEISLRPHQ